MTCKDCLHYEVCVVVENSESTDEDYLTEFGCEDFKDRTKWVEQKHGRWIPITERMPEENGAYLVATERGGVLITHYWKDGQRFSTTRSRCAITHWRERPRPPKEEG